MTTILVALLLLVANVILFVWGIRRERELRELQARIRRQREWLEQELSRSLP